jgi:nicotinate-nucleotide adenylyltransferase
MKLGIFGGTFNPPHLGHLIVAESVREQAGLDTVLFIPSANPPNKSGQFVARAADRLHMTQIAVEGNPAFAVSEIETRRGGISYTVDTVSEIAAANAGAELFLIMGNDNLMEFESWKSPDAIVAKSTLVAVGRQGFARSDLRTKYERLALHMTVPQIAISGTEVRRRVRMGRSIRYLVPPAVEEFIVRTGLYRN